MAPNLPPVITVNKNLASTLRNYIKQNGGKNVSEAQMNQILQRLAKFDAERDAGTRAGGSIFDGGSKYLGGDSSNFKVKQGQEIQLSSEEFNEIFKGYIDPVKTSEETTAPAQPEKKPPPVEKPKLIVPEADLDNIKIEKFPQTKPNGATTQKPENSTEDNKVKALFPDGLPEGVTTAYVNIGGTQTLIFKKDGKTLDQNELRELVNSTRTTHITQNDAPEPATNNEMAGLPETTNEPPAPTITVATSHPKASDTNNDTPITTSIQETPEVADLDTTGHSPEEIEILTTISNLKEGETYNLKKVKSSLEVVNSDLQQINYEDNVYITKSANGNITVTNQNNEQTIYNSNGQILSSTGKDLTFDIWNKFGEITTHSDYQANKSTYDLRNATINQYTQNDFIDRLAIFDNGTVYDFNNQVLFTSTRATTKYGPKGEDLGLNYNFKDKNGNNLSKEAVLDLLSNNKPAKLEMNNQFDLSYIYENHTLEKDLF